VSSSLGRWCIFADVKLGPGQIRPLQPIPTSLLDRKFVWSPPPAALQDAELNTFVNTLISRSFEGVTAPVVRIEDPNDLTDQCPSNFASLSDCFAAVIFGNVEPDTQTLVSLFPVFSQHVFCFLSFPELHDTGGSGSDIGQYRRPER
jgi:hypothetical protein